MYRYFRDIWFLSKLGQYWKRSNSLLIHFTSGSFLNFPFRFNHKLSNPFKIYSDKLIAENTIDNSLDKAGNQISEIKQESSEYVEEKITDRISFLNSEK